jgi:hypothetical protein
MRFVCEQPVKKLCRHLRQIRAGRDGGEESFRPFPRFELGQLLEEGVFQSSDTSGDA